MEYNEQVLEYLDEHPLGDYVASLELDRIVKCPNTLSRFSPMERIKIARDYEANKTSLN